MSPKQGLFIFAAAVYLYAKADKRGVRFDVDVERLLDSNSRTTETETSKARGRRYGNRGRWGTIPFERVGQRRLYRVADLDAWFDSVAHTLPPATPGSFRVADLLAAA